MKKAFAAGALFATVLLALFAAPQASRPPGPPGPPALILVIAIDQMRFDSLTRFDGLYKGGIRKLLREGAVFSNAMYRHSGTETGAGHAVILSGRHPANSGIVANDWWDPLLRAEVNVIGDPVHSPVGGAGSGASPANFLGFTVGDALKAKNPASKVVGLAIKDRAAILMAGRRADAAYWFAGDGNFITSTYYMLKAPDWLTELNSQRLPDRYHARGWTLLEDRRLYEKYAGRDDMPGEGFAGRNPLLPKPFPAAPPARAYYDEFRRTPFAEEVMAQFAIAAMKAHRLGEDAATDILALGFSSTDYVGHDYGPGSQESLDQLLRLDRTLDLLFQHVDRTVGLQNTVIAVTADHGVMPLVEVLKEQGIDARRADRQVLLDAVQKALAARFPGAGGLIVKTDFDIYSMYFDEELVRKNGLSMRDVEDTARNAIMSTGFAERVYSKSDLLNTSPSNDPYIRLYRNSFFAPRSGNLAFLPKRYLTFWDRGASHGTAYDYDRHVPVVFAGPGIRPGTYTAECGPEDIAPTIARMLGLDFPIEPDARLLTEMLR